MQVCLLLLVVYDVEVVGYRWNNMIMKYSFDRSIMPVEERYEDELLDALGPVATHTKFSSLLFPPLSREHILPTPLKLEI